MANSNFSAQDLANLVVGSKGFASLATWVKPKRWNESVFGSEENLKKQFLAFEVKKASKTAFRLFFPALIESYPYTKNSVLKDEQMLSLYYFSDSPSVLPLNSTVHSEFIKNLEDFLFSNSKEDRLQTTHSGDDNVAVELGKEDAMVPASICKMKTGSVLAIVNASRKTISNPEAHPALAFGQPNILFWF